MNLIEAISTIRRLSESDNDNRENSKPYEIACKVLAENWAKDKLGSYKYDLFYRIRRPIDITITVQIPSLPTGPGKIIGGDASEINERHYFLECKFYGRPLGLDVLGKSYLMALRFKPVALVIVSNTAPTEIANNFAQWVCEQVGRDLSITYWNPLFDQSPSKNPEKRKFTNLKLDYKEKFIKAIEIDSWSVWRDETFDKTPIARSVLTNGIRKIELSPGEIIIFEISLKFPKINLSDLSIQMRLEGINSIIKIQLTENSKFGNIIRAKGEMSSWELNAGVEYRDCQIVITSRSGEDILKLGSDFPVINRIFDAIQLPDLRKGKAQDEYLKWKKSHGKPLLTVKGEGGVGKTYLCEQIAALAKKDGFHTSRSTLTVETGVGFISEFLWLLLPSEVRYEMRKLADVALTEEFIRTVVGNFDSVENNEITNSLAQLLLTERWPINGHEMIIQTIARLLVGSTRPLIFFVSNCQRVAEAPANILKTLLGALEQEGWGQVKVVLEYRDTVEDIGESWRVFLAWMDKTVGHRHRAVSINPLRKEELAGAFADMLITNDAIEATKIIIEKAGGNPLYLHNLFRILLEKNLLLPTLVNSKSNKIKFSLENLNNVRNFLVDLNPDVEMLLFQRIQYLHEDIKKTFPLGAFSIGLNSIFGSVLSVKLISILSSTTEKDIELLLIRFKDAGLLKRCGDDSFSFSHEFAKSAAKNWFCQSAESTNIALNAASSEIPNEYSMLLAKAKINSFLGRVEQAVESFNFAAQTAGSDFGKLLPCYLSIADELANGNSESICIAYHAAIEKATSMGYYLLGRREIINLNKKALSALEWHSGTLQITISDGLRRYYNHAISSAAIHLMEWDTYFEHTANAIDACKNELEMAQILNRVVKSAALNGHFIIAHSAGLLAISLQKNIDITLDKSLPNVLHGEMASMYLQFDIDVASSIVMMMLLNDVDDRQKVHDLIIAATVKFVTGDTFNCLNYLNSADEMIKKMGLSRLQINSSLLRGVLHLSQTRYRAAAEMFKIQGGIAAYQDNIRDEIKCGNNLLVARIAFGDIKGGVEIYERMIVIAKRNNKILDEQKLKVTISQINSIIKSSLKFVEPSLDEKLLYPRPSTEYSSNIFSVFFYNAITLNKWNPDLFIFDHLMLKNEFFSEVNEVRLPKAILDVFVNEFGISLKAIC